MRKLIAFLFLVTFSTVNAQGYLADIQHSATSVVLPCIPLRALDDSPAGGTLETGITNATAGLTIDVRTDVTNGWMDQYSQASGTINAITGNIGEFETPDTNDAHFEEIASGAGCYQLILDDTTWSVASSKYVEILIRDSSSPTFADTLVRVNLNAIAAADLVDDVWDEPCAGHTTSDTPGDNICDEFDALEVSVSDNAGAIVDLTDGTTPVWVYAQTLNELTADAGGSTTTLVDTALTEADTDYWLGAEIVFLSGTLDGQTACVTGFNTTTDTLTFSPAVTQSVSGHTYVLNANGACKVNDQVAEDQDGGYSAKEVLSLLLSEAIGDCTYTSGTRTWVCDDPSGTEQRFSIVLDVALDGTRGSVSATPATP